MDIKEFANRILLPSLSKRSMMVIWIFAAALLMTLANPNLTHDAGFLSTNPQVPLTDLAAPSPDGDMFENMIERDNPAIKAHENAQGPIVAEPVNPDPAATESQPRANEIVIAKIGARVPIVTATTTNEAKLHSLLDNGAVLYPTSAGFGKIGQTVLLGHSAPANWPNIKHDTAFSRINELVKGDLVEIYYQDRTYKYEVTRSQVIAKGTDLDGESPDKSWLVLVTCWPPGRDRDRIAIETVFVE
ncbi:MAG: class E sortase [Candidatus Pacebacteria bacterium]|jgi:LPXTG-site transpeptidase (sortase) family protein|nr:class E sortase [Candidatus Paceibacterota bacterium]